MPMAHLKRLLLTHRAKSCRSGLDMPHPQFLFDSFFWGLKSLFSGKTMALYKKNASYVPLIFHFKCKTNFLLMVSGLTDVFIFFQRKIGREGETDSYIAQAGELLNSYLSLLTAGIRIMCHHTVQLWAVRIKPYSLCFLQHGGCYGHCLKDISAKHVRKRKYLWEHSLQVSSL